jgi:hypothetical protein
LRTLELVNKIYNKFEGEIPKIVLEDVIRITCDHIREEVKNDRQYSIDGFGTFSSGYFKYNNSGNKYIKCIVFKYHVIFLSLSKRKRNMFKKVKK